jgi:hypothetical protein
VILFVFFVIKDVNWFELTVTCTDVVSRVVLYASWLLVCNICIQYLGVELARIICYWYKCWLTLRCKISRETWLLSGFAVIRTLYYSTGLYCLELFTHRRIFHQIHHINSLYTDIDCGGRFPKCNYLSYWPVALQLWQFKINGIKTSSEIPWNCTHNSNFLIVSWNCILYWTACCFDTKTDCYRRLTLAAQN